MAKINKELCTTHGPWGGPKGEHWTYMPIGFIKKISIKSGGIIDSLKFQSTISGETQISFFGGKGGDQSHTICIDYPDEYLTSIKGTIGEYEGAARVQSLCFITNQNCYGPYGPNGPNTKTRFSYDGKGGVIVGFYGRANKYMNAIGIFVMPKSLALSRNITCEDKPIYEMSRMAMPREAGPWGACGGKPWDDGVFSYVKQVHIHVGRFLNVIHAVHFVYVKHDSKSIISQLHGGMDADKTETVNLDGLKEYLTGISGFYGPVEGYNGLEAVKSITFHTNKTIYGPYGQESGAGYAYFSSTAYPGKIVGFHGRNDEFLSAIGVHMEYF